MEDLTAYKMFKDMAASNIFACVPEKIINEAKIQDIALDDWNIAISFLREWSTYTKKLEEENEKLKDRQH